MIIAEHHIGNIAAISSGEHKGFAHDENIESQNKKTNKIKRA